MYYYISYVIKIHAYTNCKLSLEEDNSLSRSNYYANLKQIIKE